MPKLKTHSGIAKRIKLSATGKLLRRRAYRSHLLSGKSAARKRNYVKEFEVNSGDVRSIKQMLGGK